MSNQPQPLLPREKQGYLKYTMSAEQVAAELGVTKSRVCQIEIEALKKLRRALEERGISLDDLLEA